MKFPLSVSPGKEMPGDRIRQRKNLRPRRESSPRPLDLIVRCYTDCATLSRNKIVYEAGGMLHLGRKEVCFDNNEISLNLVRYIASIFRPLTCSVVIHRYGFGRYPK